MTTMDKKTAKKLGEGLYIIGIEPEEISKVVTEMRRSTVAESELILEKFKSKVKKLWKQRVFECHPDRTGNDEEFKKIVDLMDILDKMKVKKNQTIKIIRLY